MTARLLLEALLNHIAPCQLLCLCLPHPGFRLAWDCRCELPHPVVVAVCAVSLLYMLMCGMCGEPVYVSVCVCAQCM